MELLKEKVLEIIKDMCEYEGLDAKPRIYTIARLLNADKRDVITVVDELVQEGTVEYKSDIPSESHICLVLRRDWVKNREKKRKLSKEFYVILQESECCPMETYNKIVDKSYNHKEFEYMCRLLYRWTEWQKLSGIGGRIYYDYLKLLEEYA
jgi:hypothetical protein